MGALNTHWTERDIGSFLYRIASDFVRHVESLLEHRNINQAELADRLSVSQGRVSQVMNDPGNLTIKQIIKYSRALGEKVAIISYDDNDADNVNGPIAPEIFAECWKRAGKPTDFFELNPSDHLQYMMIRVPEDSTIQDPIQNMNLDVSNLEGTASNPPHTQENASG